jgi:uncharacterized membrane protein
MSNYLVKWGVVLVFIGILRIFLSSFTGVTQQKNTSMKTAGGMFISPFPLFGFASDKKMLYSLMAIAFLLTTLYILVMRTK